jgi:hypothetical protein
MLLQRLYIFFIKELSLHEHLTISQQAQKNGADGG